MSVIALYVFSPTTFTTNSTIEALTGGSYTAGEVTLNPGVYRLAEGATIVANSARTASRGESFFQGSVEGTKGGWPDPPQQAIDQFGMTQIKNFLGGAGEANTF
jgi:hypothetical protein